MNNLYINIPGFAACAAVGILPCRNVFNLFIPGIDDVFYREGSLFKVILLLTFYLFLLRSL
jgi:hypothetical protein